MTYFSFYSNFMNNYTDSQKFKFFRPIYKILDKDNKPNIYSSENINNENAVYWWKYSIRMVVKNLNYFNGK